MSTKARTRRIAAKPLLEVIGLGVGTIPYLTLLIVWLSLLTWLDQNFTSTGGL